MPMRRRLSLALLAVLVVLAAVVSVRHLSSRTSRQREVASAGTSRDSLARLDSASRADSREPADTMCFASRLFLPCDPR
jgi:hypothetical protein